MNLLNKDFADRSWILRNEKAVARKHNRMLLLATFLTIALIRLL
jgi:hypothetical protein